MRIVIFDVCGCGIRLARYLLLSEGEKDITFVDKNAKQYWRIDKFTE